MRAIGWVFLLWVGAAWGQSPDFYGHWADGRAELSSYRVVQPRYGEAREGYAVLIFVTEDIHRQTYIKVESPTAEKDRLYVLKLNHVLKFNTGIYDYSVMGSVFSQVEGDKDPFELRKLSLSAQEWCGHVFDEAQIRDGRLLGQLNSYFESEGKRAYELEVPADFESEDHLLIKIRELKGSLMAEGEQRQVALLPSLWSFRLQHRPHALRRTALRKGHVQEVEVGGQGYRAVPWSWEGGEGQRTVWVEAAYPHRILRWEDEGGGRGELVKSVRLPYWKLHGEADEHYRGELGID